MAPAAFNQRAFALAEELIQAESANRQMRFGKRIAEVRSNFAKHGALGGSAMLESMAEICASEIDDASREAWATVHRVLTTTGVQWSPDLASQLQQRMEVVLRYSRAVPEAFFTGEQQRAKFPNQTAVSNFSTRVISSRLRILAEIKLFADSLEARMKIDNGLQQRTTINTYAPVGTIQTGANSNAQIIQNFGDTDRSELNDVLRRIEDALKEANDLASDVSLDIEEAVSEVRSEIEKPKPSGILFLPKLQALAIAISSVESLAAGYQMLKAFLAAHGIFLP